MPGRRRMLGEILVDMGYVMEEDIREALEAQREGEQKKLGEILVEQEYVTQEDVTRALSEQHGLEMVDLLAKEIPPEIIELIPQDMARQHHVVPVELRDGTLIVAVSDPLNVFSLDELRFLLNRPIEPVLATEEAISRSLTELYGIREQEVEEMLDQMGTDIEFVEELDDGGQAGSDEAPIIRLVHTLILNAVRQRASDVHVEPMADRLRIRYRVDGVCYEIDPPPKRLQGPIISRIKIMAGMDMAEKRRPQDGAIRLNMLGRSLDLRVSAVPANHGESVVMRILDKEAMLVGLPELGFHPDDYAIFSSLIKKPNGVILITGPTGSGKTTTLYAALNELNRPDRKIITAEDPVEYNLPGINQCQVNRAAGLTFQRILRSMLRQAPEIILVGEIRDRETAEIGVQAALTGHLVFSTLHTNDAPSAITRLVDLGVASFLVASSIQAVMAQRLVRMLCAECREEAEPDLGKFRGVGVTANMLQGRTIYTPVGCDKCNYSGFLSRKGIFEIMVMNNRLREMTFHKVSTEALRKQAINDGMHTLLADGVRKVLDGLTTLQEVFGQAKSVD